tara:strand:+ start:656 stop:1213 length:558 start_codon:yes stop_codon:yes gene_type:complete
MSCHKCKSSPCGCNDHGLETPCTYNDCEQPSEPCEDIQCAECVSYCGPYFQITEPGDPTDVLFSVSTGDRLEEILQKIALYLKQPDCAKPYDNHAVYHVQLSNITNDSVLVTWSGVSTTTTGFNVYWSEISGVWVQANIGLPLAASATQFNVTGLDPQTTYLFKVEALDPAGDCDSVEVEATTLL